ncbi:MAG TPA: PAS domain S-box protein [Ohtaekwangia sp.]|nr:PAS domain S-box protein [Ohtaekwangia sp.]
MENFEQEQALVLIVDDKETNIFAMQNLLEYPGRKFLKATHGSEALKFALNNNIDLIILDVQMPDMDGFEVAEILRSNKKTRNIPIIFASAEKTEHHAVLKGFEEGAIDYLFKPLDPEITKAKVSVHLKVQQQQKELMRKNAALEKSALLINNSADIIGIIDATTFAIETINHAFTVLLGYAPEEITGTSLLFFLNDLDKAQVQKLAKSEKDRLSFETRIYCKDRNTKWLDWNVVVKDRLWFVNARDITGLKEIEKIRNHLATVVKQSSDAVYLHDEEGRIISWNEGAEKIYGYTEADALKMHIWNIIPEFLQPETQEMFDVVFAGGKIHSRETKRITKFGQFVDVLFSASAITDSAINQMAIAITERDITQQKIADRQIGELNADLKQNVMQLEETNKELESFSYSVSHDLRAPLRALGGNARILEEDYESILDDEGKKVLGKISRNVTKMNRLIEDLLAFSKVGTKEIRKSKVEMKDQVLHVIDEMSVPDNATIEVKDLPPANVDQSLFVQVWVNLISNAIKYSGKKQRAEIVVGASENESETTYYVKDNGAGFDMAYADKLFGTFQRLHDNTQFEGTGIGLAIVKRIITKHGGSIWAEAKPDWGAVFYFTVPKKRAV